MFGRPGAFGGHMNHSFRTATSLRCRFTHPGLEQSLCLETIHGGVERPNGALAPCRIFDLISDGATVGFVFEVGGGGDDQVFELAEHINYIAILTLG